MKRIILAIESSCDETAAAVGIDGKNLSNIIANQTIHQQYGGVVPELASRAHQQNIVPVVDQALKEADVTKDRLHAIAFTQGPGLLGALMVGASFAKALAFGLNIPLIAVNHMRGHIFSNFIESSSPTFPFISLVVSGGHTQLVLVKDPTNMEVIGQTKDDAVGEAFDKIAKIMGFEYPGGPFIDQYAQKGNPSRFKFPATKMPELDFSFSGIKTAFLYLVQKESQKNADFVTLNKHDLCASIQSTLVSMLLDKLVLAVDQTGVKQIALAGGVAANSALREKLLLLGKKNNWQVFLPNKAYCTDNAAMIAMAADFQFLAGDFCNYDVKPMPRMPLST